MKDMLVILKLKRQFLAYCRDLSYYWRAKDIVFAADITKGLKEHVVNKILNKFVNWRFWDTKRKTL